MAFSKPIVLTGMMGSGKTSIGKKLAERLQLPFIDLDDEIEREQKAKIPDIFSKYGEAAFRRIEKQKLHALLTREPAVIATGGGAVIDEGTRTMLADCAIAIWLKVDVEILARRVEGDANRPLLASDKDKPEKVLRRILEQREPFYAQALVTLPNNGSDIDLAVEDILAALKKYT